MIITIVQIALSLVVQTPGENEKGSESLKLLSVVAGNFVENSYVLEKEPMAPVKCPLVQYCHLVVVVEVSITSYLCWNQNL